MVVASILELRELCDIRTESLGPPVAAHPDDLVAEGAGLKTRCRPRDRPRVMLAERGLRASDEGGANDDPEEGPSTRLRWQASQSKPCGTAIRPHAIEVTGVAVCLHPRTPRRRCAPSSDSEASGRSGREDMLQLFLDALPALTARRACISTTARPTAGTPDHRVPAPSAFAAPPQALRSAGAQVARWSAWRTPERTPGLLLRRAVARRVSTGAFAPLWFRYHASPARPHARVGLPKPVTRATR
jgi:hypothetical protein